MNAATIAFVGLGGNLGDAAGRLRQALLALDRLPGTHLVRASRLYRTPAWGLTAQPDFVNAVAMIDTALAPLVLLQHLLHIERDAGRNRVADDAVRWGPRTLDLDLLLYGEEVIAIAGLSVPHPHLHERAFALVPLLEIAPDVHIPNRGPGAELLARLPALGVQALG